MNYRIVQLEANVDGLDDNDRFGVYCGAELVFDFTGQDALSICIEWRADAQS
jgi:hypothetical protein